MPYHPSDKNKENLYMVECDHCHEWYHRQCISITAIDLDPFTNTVSKDYICKKCKDNGRGFSGW